MVNLSIVFKAAYNIAYLNEERVRINLLTDIFNLLTKRGESKAGLLMSYVQLPACGEVFTQMINRSIEFLFTNRVEALTVNFIMWE